MSMTPLFKASFTACGRGEATLRRSTITKAPSLTGIRTIARIIFPRCVIVSLFESSKAR